MQLLLQDFAHPLLCCTVDAGHLAEVEGAVDVHLRHGSDFFTSTCLSVVAASAVVVAEPERHRPATGSPKHSRHTQVTNRIVLQSVVTTCIG